MSRLKKVRRIVGLIIALVVVFSGIVPQESGVTTVQASTKVKLNKSKVTLYVGETVKLKVKNTSKTVTWSTSKKSVATVSKKGKVTAKKAGKATITATVGKKEYKCKVTVEDRDVDFLKENIDVKMKIPHVGTDNSYVELTITNTSGYELSISGKSFNNGYTCHLDCDGTQRYTLESGYYVTLTFYRSFLWADRFDKKYNDMYLDNESTGWLMINLGDDVYQITYDKNGTVELEKKSS